MHLHIYILQDYKNTATGQNKMLFILCCFYIFLPFLAISILGILWFFLAIHKQCNGTVSNDTRLFA